MITGIVVLRFYRLIPFVSLGANGFDDCLCSSLGIFSVVDSNQKHTHCVPLHLLCIVGFFFLSQTKTPQAELWTRRHSEETVSKRCGVIHIFTHFSIDFSKPLTKRIVFAILPSHHHNALLATQWCHQLQKSVNLKLAQSTPILSTKPNFIQYHMVYYEWF